MKNKPEIMYWYGRPIESLTREELVTAFADMIDQYNAALLEKCPNPLADHGSDLP